MNGIRRRIGFGIVVAGATCLVWAGWIPAKAVLAQRLIANAWAEALGGKADPRPWPWADTMPIARLTVPRLDQDLIVLAGASGQSLAFGPAHVSSSARPGDSDHVVIAGHRDTHFAFLRELEFGDEIRLESKTGAHWYRVIAMDVVHESRVEILESTGEPELTLLTCYPFDSIVPGGPLRYVVSASLLSVEGGDS